MKRILAVALVLAIAGCATVGKEMSDESVAAITDGQTTEAQLVAQLGRPYSTVTNSNGTRMMVWTYAKANAFGGARGKSVSVVLRDGVVESHSVAEVATP
ncbi:TPA: hypothetical protein ACJ509_000294 [Stenotrophomonas maltophilia]